MLYLHNPQLAMSLYYFMSLPCQCCTSFPSPSHLFITRNLYCTRGHDTESIVNGSISVQRDNYGKFTYVCGKQQLQSWL